MIKFLNINEEQAFKIAKDPEQQYTPAYDNKSAYYHYQDYYTPEEEPYTTEFTEQEADGLTPQDPTKPMFPKKK